MLVFLAVALTARAQNKRGASLAEQRMCSEQAQKFQTGSNMVVNHYDKARNICYVRTMDMLYDKKDDKKFIGTAYELRDAFEEFSYGMCYSDATDKVLTCWALQPSTGKKSTFTSSDEWLSFVGQNYMSD